MDIIIIIGTSLSLSFIMCLAFFNLFTENGNGMVSSLCTEHGNGNILCVFVH